MTDRFPVVFTTGPRRATRVSEEAFYLVFEVLDQTINRVHGLDARHDSVASHVTGRDMCRDLHRLAAERWGLLAPDVLRAWGIHCTLDFGRIVHALIDAGILSRSETDCLSDFQAVFDFDTAWAIDRGGRRVQHA